MKYLFFLFCFFSASLEGFCQNSYAELKTVLDGGYHQVPGDHILRFRFFEAYNAEAGANLDFTVYSIDHQVVSIGQNVSGNYGYGENLISLNVSSLPPEQFYVLEVRNRKGEKFYLRFRTS